MIWWGQLHVIWLPFLTFGIEMLFLNKNFVGIEVKEIISSLHTPHQGHKGSPEKYIVMTSV